MKDTPSRVALIHWCEGPGAALRIDVTRELGLANRGQLRKWMLGISRPDPHLREALEIVTDGAVLAAGWMTDTEAALLVRLREARGPSITHARARTPSRRATGT